MARGIFKEAVEFYKQRKEEERQKEILINSKCDFSLLEQLVQKCNENPNLRIDIHLNDGTVLYMKTYYQEQIHDLINGSYVEEIK